MLKKIICITLALVMSGLVLVSCDDSDAQENIPAEPFVAPKYDEIDRSKIESLDGVSLSDEQTDYVLIEVADYGKILVRLYPNVAPITVANFKKLVSEKFYDGIIFHRVMDGFMIQGGDPEGTGYGGSDETIKGEFASNGFTNNLLHTRGVLSMARRSKGPNSASSQFFICHKSSGCAHLNGDYAAFGYVVNGMDVVDKIASVRTDDDDKPKKDVVISSIRFATVEISDAPAQQ